MTDGWPISTQSVGSCSGLIHPSLTYQHILGLSVHGSGVSTDMIFLIICDPLSVQFRVVRDYIGSVAKCWFVRWTHHLTFLCLSFLSEKMG